MHTKPFRGVEIEVCDDCGSVLLDQGELEKLSGQDESGMLSGILSLFGG
ncbi:MAG: Zn-finger nucleic acid-binding protein [Myxococcota bacterium]|jgi:Zn-finger nucleic acid-binding protein